MVALKSSYQMFRDHQIQQKLFRDIQIRYLYCRFSFHSCNKMTDVAYNNNTQRIDYKVEEYIFRFI